MIRAMSSAAGLVVLYTLVISMADAITKGLSSTYAAPQMFAISGAVVVLLSVATASLKLKRESLATRHPRAMAVRSAATVLACFAFFMAFRMLPFANVFLFIGLMPIFAALMAGPVLNEAVSPSAWVALGLGLLGIFCLFPEGVAAIEAGHAVALLAALSGTVSIVVSRYIGVREHNGLAQVFYPNLTILLVMGAVLPFVWQPMSSIDVFWAALYGGLLFVARWLLVVALRGVAAHVATTLMKLQFVWMVVLGAVLFGEYPGWNVYLGVAIVVGSGLFLLFEGKQLGFPRRAMRQRQTNPSSIAAE